MLKKTKKRNVVLVMALGYKPKLWTIMGIKVSRC